MAIKRYQGQLKETIQAFEDQARLKQQITEQVGINERKAGALVGELEESRALLDGAERSKRQIDAEIASSRNAVSEMQTINSKDQTVKRGLEAAIHTVSAEIDATLMAAKNAEEKSKKAMMDASRLAAELRGEQDHTTTQLAQKRSAEASLTELANKLQAKIKTYKQQIEEAEEIAALNLAKFRKAQQELEETSERAALAEMSARL